MLVQEVLKGVDFEKVWPIIEKEYYADEEPGKQKEGYSRLLKELCEVQSKDCSDKYLLAVGYYDDVAYAADEEFEEPPITVCCSMYDVKGHEEYSLLLTPWEEVLGYKIAPYSIEHFDKDTLAAHIMYELSWFGFTHKQVETRMNEMEQSLREAQKEAEQGKTLSSEEVFAELGILPDEGKDKKRTVEEYRLLNKEISRKAIESIELDSKK